MPDLGCNYEAPTLASMLRASGSGFDEWRVQDKSGAYCMAYSYQCSINPERDAREWLENHRREFPDSPKASYEVAKVHTQTAAQVLMCRAADELDALAAELVETRRERDEALTEVGQLQTTVIQMGDKLTAIVNTIRGEPEPDTSHSTHDAADLVRGLKMHSDALAGEVERLRGESFDAVCNMVARDLPNDGSTVAIHLERHAGSVNAADWDGNEWDEPADTNSMAERVRAAVEWCKAKSDAAREAAKADKLPPPDYVDEDGGARYWEERSVRKIAEQHAAELSKTIGELRADVEENEATRATMEALLERTAAAIRGTPAPGTRHGWADLPERAGAALASVGGALKAAQILAGERGVLLDLLSVARGPLSTIEPDDTEEATALAKLLRAIDDVLAPPAEPDLVALAQVEQKDGGEA